MSSIVCLFVKKLGFGDNKTLIEKTDELLRRLESKSIGHIIKSSDNAKALICIDLASEILGLQMDSKLLLRWSGFGKSEYIRNKRTFEKILDISQNFDIPKICIQLGISHVQKSAQQIYNDYTSYASQLNNSVLDLTHPQYFTMAVYQACKKDKVKVLKSNLIKLSHLKPQQWEKLEQSWNTVIDKSKVIKLQTTKSIQEIATRNENLTVSNKIIYSHNSKGPSDSYNSWRTNLLRKSYKKLIDSQSIDYIDIYIIGFVLELKPEDIKNAKHLLDSYYKCIELSENPFVPKYSAMAIYKAMSSGKHFEDDLGETKNYLQEYSELSYLQWASFENEWTENMRTDVKVAKESMKLKYHEFDEWILDFARI